MKRLFYTVVPSHCRFQNLGKKDGLDGLSESIWSAECEVTIPTDVTIPTETSSCKVFRNRSAMSIPSRFNKRAYTSPVLASMRNAQDILAPWTGEAFSCFSDQLTRFCVPAIRKSSGIQEFKEFHSSLVVHKAIVHGGHTSNVSVGAIPCRSNCVPPKKQRT